MAKSRDGKNRPGFASPSKRGDFVQFTITLCSGPGRGEKLSPRGTHKEGHKYVGGGHVINIVLLKVWIGSTCQGQGWLSSHQPGFWEPIDLGFAAAGSGTAVRRR